MKIQLHAYAIVHDGRLQGMFSADGRLLDAKNIQFVQFFRTVEEARAVIEEQNFLYRDLYNVIQVVLEEY